MRSSASRRFAGRDEGAVGTRLARRREIEDQPGRVDVVIVRAEPPGPAR